ncbi:MAG: trimethylamine methyltransferase family protein, partial [Candidatus Aegiribacteria sp.]|nr:trimethylamine methyltransferase family protein [Candidatus Aegiribacteria sp.]
MRPVLRLLSNELIERIISEARDILCDLGMEIHNDGILSMLSDHGAAVDPGKKHVHFTADIIDKALETAPDSVKLYDVMGRQTHDLTDHNVYFTPGSAAINIL